MTAVPASPGINGARAAARGFTLAELAVAMAVFAVLVGVLLTRVAYYQERAEEVAVRQTVEILRTALRLKVSQLYVTNRLQDVAALADDNPIDWLKDKPGNYIGEYFSPEIKDIPAGNWYFDRRDKTLVYLFNGGNSLHTTALHMIKLKVRRFNLPETSAKLPSSSSVVESIVLDQVND